ncbi:MAG: hypothetical protein WCC57_09775 [Paracoccaceae bacterium]
MMRRLLPFALILLAHFASAETPKEGFAAAASAQTKVTNLEFHDDPTDVSGKAWEFTKALVGASGVKGLDNVMDAADFIKAGQKDGYSPELILTAGAKSISANFTTKRAEELVGKMSQSEMFKAAIVIGFEAKDTSAETATAVQRRLVEYMVETAPAVAVTAGQEGALPAGQQLFLDIMGKACPPCDAAYKGYDLAAESSKALQIAFENEKTQAMFNQMKTAGWYREDEFAAGYTGNSTLQAEARTALETMWKAAGKTGTPTEDEVLGFVFDRFQRWQQEAADKAKLDEVITKIEPYYIGLAGYEKTSMYGPGDEATHAGAYINDYQTLWAELTGMKGNATWPFGLGQAGVEAQVAGLVKRWRYEGLSDEQIAWEMAKLGADWGWIAPDMVGPKPPSPLSQIEKGIAGRLPQLSVEKLGALLASAGITPTADFMNCMCPGGFHFYDGEDAMGPCRRIGSLGGVSWAGIDGNAVMGCSAAYPLPDGRTVTGALAAKLVDIRKAQQRAP